MYCVGRLMALDDTESRRKTYDTDFKEYEMAQSVKDEPKSIQTNYVPGKMHIHLAN